MQYNTYPYTMYPANSYLSCATQPAQYTQQPANPPQQNQSGIAWVDGEVGAKAYQLPAGWPANTPMPLWDTNDTIIYLKSTNPMGMPNPLQRIHYRMEEQEQHASGTSFASSAPALMSGEHHEQYATKEDIERMKEELRKSIAETVKGVMEG